jgi:peroxiredoxin
MARIGRRAIMTGMAGAFIAEPVIAAKVGKPAPYFFVVTFDHQKISLSDLKGEVVVLNYWATWCAPCKLELVVLENYLRRHPGTDLKIFAIDTDESVPIFKLKPLAAQLSFPLIRELDGWGYGIIGDQVPTSYVIDRAGIIRHAQAGAFTDETFDALVTPLLAAAPQQQTTGAGAIRT